MNNRRIVSECQTISRSSMTDEILPRPGQRIVVRTPDRREYRGELLELRTGSEHNAIAVVRLDTGWLTSYPVSMVHVLEEPSRGV